MKGNQNLTVGTRVRVTPHGNYEFRNSMYDMRGREIPGSRNAIWHQPRPWAGIIRVVLEHYYIVSYDDPALGSPWPTQGYAEHVVEACSAAGLDPTLHIGLASRHADEIEVVLPGFEQVFALDPDRLRDYLKITKITPPKPDGDNESGESA